MKISGIYKIQNNLNGKMYIGQSVNCYGRWLKHKSDYKHLDLPLYQDMRKYGIENFYFKVIEKMPAYLLNTREQEYIEKYNTLVPNGYNILKSSSYSGQDNYTKDQ